MSSRRTLTLSPPSGRASQVPRLIFPRALSPITPEGPDGCIRSLLGRFTCAASSCSGVSGCNYLTYNGHNYLLCTTTKTWADAREFCRSYGGDLAAINDAAENIELTNSMGAHFLIGFTDQATEGTFVWSHGAPSPATYTSWHTATGEPNDGYGAGEDCAAACNEWGTTNNWNDQSCTVVTAFVCEDNFASNPYDADSDGDGLNDGPEVATGSQPNIRDTDADGFDDQIEVAFG
jgi:hypothetical protein